MITQTHSLMGVVLFGRHAPRFAVAAGLGGLIPDLPMYVIIIYLRVSGHPLSEIFGKIYWEHWWQVSNAIGHSFILWGAILAGSLLAKARSWSGVGVALSASALLHSAVDFLLHHNDAHMHFWPLTEWRFRSPVSYWDSNYFGHQFAIFEAALGVALALILWRRYHALWIRAVLAMLIATYIFVPMSFVMSHG